jgi:hypothetical protein
MEEESERSAIQKNRETLPPISTVTRMVNAEEYAIGRDSIRISDINFEVL